MSDNELLAASVILVKFKCSYCLRFVLIYVQRGFLHTGSVVRYGVWFPVMVSLISHKASNRISRVWSHTRDLILIVQVTNCIQENLYLTDEKGTIFREKVKHRSIVSEILFSNFNRLQYNSVGDVFFNIWLIQHCQNIFIFRVHTY